MSQKKSDKSETEGQKHILSVLVENKFGVLVRVSGLFSRRGYNIDSLSVAVTENPSISRMTIVVRADDQVLEQVKKQLNKLIDVIKVIDLNDEEHVERELALIKVKTVKDTKPEILQIVDVFRAKVIDIATDSFIIEVTGDDKKIEAIETLLRPFEIQEMVRTGRVGLSRGYKEGSRDRN